MRKHLLMAVLCLLAVASVVGCGDVPTMVGEKCQLTEHCGGSEANLALTCDTSIPGGSCQVTSCTPDNPATDAAEDLASCPEGARCVTECAKGVRCDSLEVPTHTVCRRSCEQQRDCGEVIVCTERCDTVDDQEVCHLECANELECVPIWYPLPENATDPPRACIIKGRQFKPKA